MRCNPTHVRAAAAVLLAGFALGGCGIPLDENPRSLPTANSAPSAQESTTSIPLGTSEKSTMIWYWAAQADKLIPVTRAVDGTSASAVIQAALAPLDEADLSRGIITRIPEGATLLGAPDIVNKQITINLSTEFNNYDGPARRAAFAQLVMTAVQIPGVRTVTFLVDGKPVDVTAPAGQSSAVTDCDFKDSLAAGDVAKDVAMTTAEIAVLEARRSVLETTECP